ncbi:hypothetical protein [Hymenobacter cavernae]|uniref:hypothetical protein n=1 Tax=Hymenobacter cavernae TaxID=2044852 RepID=UPI001669E457|nr:hypothetical protein [Hymenobacter cavernae]
MRVAAHQYFLPLFLLLGITACSSDPRKPVPVETHARATVLTKLGPYFDSQWAMNELWEDSLAEVATYAAEQVVDDEIRRFDCTLITQKEEFTPQYNVKTDDYARKDLFPVLKVSQMYSVPTDQYPRHFLTSLFFRRDQPVPLYKLTTSVQDGCGTTFKAINDDGLQYLEVYDSYRDKQGAGRRQLRHEVLFEDALPYTLRSLRFARFPAFSVAVCATRQTNDAQPPAYYAAQVRVADGLIADTAEPAWRVTVALADRKENVYWFGKQYPNLLLRQTTWDGRNLTLKSTRRAPCPKP